MFLESAFINISVCSPAAPAGLVLLRHVHGGGVVQRRVVRSVAAVTRLWGNNKIITDCVVYVNTKPILV